MTQPLDRSCRIPQIGNLDTATGEFWRENTFEMGRGKDNLSAYEPNRMYLNLDGKRFLDCSFGSGCDIDADSRSVAAADFNRDGAPDLLVGSVGGGPLRMFANQFKDGHHSVRIQLIGTKSNRAAIGARAVVNAGGRKIVRDLFPANGCLGQGPAEMLIGTGTADKIESMEIRWPNGASQTFSNVTVDGVVTIEEGRNDIEFTSYSEAQAKAAANGQQSTSITVDTPKFVAANQSTLAGEERILGLTLQNETRAYPIRFMNSHQLCHDEVAGTPVLVSYCRSSGASTAFQRELSNSEKTMKLTFNVVGMLQGVGYNVLRDRETKSLWNPLTGQCLKGPLQGTILKRVPLFVTDLQHWSQLNASTKILAPLQTEYPEIDVTQSGSKFVKNVRDSCAPDELGIGIRGATQQLFVPLNGLSRFQGSFISGRLDDRKIAIFFDATRSVVNCFYTSAAGGTRELKFSQANSAAGRFVTEDGDAYDMTGRCIEGKNKGKRLPAIADSSVLRWYAWSLTYPKTFVVKKSR